MIDSYGRTINYLRISVTDRCNLRCVYCMPPDGVRRLHHEDILTFEEITETARVAVAMGVTKIRLTGVMGHRFVTTSVTEDRPPRDGG